MKDSLLMAIKNFISVVAALSSDDYEEKDIPIYQLYLKQADSILQKVETYEDVTHDVHAMDHLFGNTWPKDEAGYLKAFSAWDTFRGLLTGSIYGMTVNERLFTLGLLDQFHNAIAKRDSPLLKAMLKKCLLDDKTIEEIINAVYERKP